MRYFKTFATLSAAVIALSALSGCALTESKEREPDNTAEVIEKEPETHVIKETDFMSFIFEENGTNYLHTTLEELNAAEDNAYTEENALEYDPDFGYVVYDLG